MCKVVQLSLNFSPINFGAEFDTLQELDAAARRQGLESYLTDPCKGCDLAEVCGHDDCAHKLYEIDSPEPPSGDWDDWFMNCSD